MFANIQIERPQGSPESLEFKTGLTRVKNTFNWNKIQLHHHAEIFSKLSRMT